MRTKKTFWAWNFVLCFFNRDSDPRNKAQRSKYEAHYFVVKNR